MRREPLAPRRRQHRVGVDVFRQGLALPLRERGGIRLAHRPREVGGGLDDERPQVRRERGRHDRAVLVGDLRVRRDDARAATDEAKRGQPRAEDEVGLLAVAVEAADLRADGEGRVVDDDAPLRIVGVLEVAAGEERADDGRSGVEAVVGEYPVADGGVDERRRIAVVGRLLRLELLDEAVVVVELGLLDSHYESSKGGVGRLRVSRGLRRRADGMA